MKNDYSEFREIIDSLVGEIDNAKCEWDRDKELNPHFEQLSDEYWRKQEATFWINGSTDIHENTKLERRLLYRPSPSELAKSQAKLHYDNWGEFICEIGNYDFTKEALSEPNKDESLEKYIERLAEQVEIDGWGPKKSKLALKCFLAYLRSSNTQKQVAFIERIFPKEMQLKEVYLCRRKVIARKIRPQVRAVSREIAAGIIKELAYQCAYGRSYARHNAGEALALLWLCMIASRIKLPKSLKSIHEIKSNAVVFTKQYPELLVPSEFGNRKIRISTRVAKFFQAVVKIPSSAPRKTILQTTLSDLRKPLNTAIQKINPPAELGEVTFLTFLSPPHYFGEYIR